MPASISMLSPTQLAALRKRVVDKCGLDAVMEFTCDTCCVRFSCPSVFDPYNSDEDCLEEK